MTFKQAIKKDLITAIAARNGISKERAASEMKAAEETAKAVGLPLAETLNILGLA